MNLVLRFVMRMSSQNFLLTSSSCKFYGCCSTCMFTEFLQLHFKMSSNIYLNYGVLVICCLVDGSVLALDASGSVVWKVLLHFLRVYSISLSIDYSGISTFDPQLWFVPLLEFCGYIETSEF